MRWAWFISFGAVGAKVVAVLAQYWVFRSIVRNKLRAEQSAPVPQSSEPA